MNINAAFKRQTVLVIKQKRALAFVTQALLEAYRRQTVLVIKQKRALAFVTQALLEVFIDVRRCW